MSNSGTAGKGGANGGGVYDQSAAAMGGSGNLLQRSAGLYNGITPGAVSTVNPALAGGSGYTGSLMSAANTANPARISAGMSGYMNPYTDQVINRSIMDMNRVTNQQNDAVGAAAANAGAFGGSRHGLVEATNLAEGQRNVGDIAAQLRSQGFNTAAQLSAQDVANQMNTGQFNANLLQQARAQNQASTNAARSFTAGNQMQANLANQASRNNASQFNATAENNRDMERVQTQLARAGGLAGLSPLALNLGTSLFGTGQQINQDQMGAGSLQQQLMQQILSRTQGQYDQFMGMPQNLLNMQLAALGMNPLTTATTTTGEYRPGLMDFLGLGVQGLGAWRMGSN